MTTDRREFVQRVALGAAAVTGLTALPMHVASALGMTPGMASSEKWDTTWTRKITGKYKAVFDVPEIESSYGVWRSQLYGLQLQDVFGAKPTEVSSVLVLRHNGIVLAMQQDYWSRYGIGKSHNATHPVTLQATERNPALLSSARGEIDAQFDAFALDRVIANGTTVLACNLALDFDVVPVIMKAENVSQEEARKRARDLLIPGVILQPSGVFASLLAQEAGCKYLRAS